MGASSLVTDEILIGLAMRLKPIFERYRVLRAIAFGSLARGEGTRRSDLDLLIIQHTTERFLDRYGELFREIVQEVSERDVDMLIYTPEEIEQLADRPFIAKVLKEGKILYESHKEPASS